MTQVILKSASTEAVITQLSLSSVPRVHDWVVTVMAGEQRAFHVTQVFFVDGGPDELHVDG